MTCRRRALLCIIPILLYVTPKQPQIEGDLSLLLDQCYSYFNPAPGSWGDLQHAVKLVDAIEVDAQVFRPMYWV